MIDLKQRGLLDDTLVVWGGEFGRTSYSQGKLTADNYGRDHHPRCFTVWMAGGGVKAGTGPRRHRRLQLQRHRGRRARPRFPRDDAALLGIDHERLTYFYQGRRFRLTDVHGQIVQALIAGSFAANCLLARRLAETGVRFIQLYHHDWDHHGNLPKDIHLQCRETDRPAPLC